MNPKDVWTQWINAKTAEAHSMAVKYIEENVELIDTDLQKFMDDCPKSCQLEVYEMFLQAGIDMKEYTVTNTLKKYVYNSGSTYTIKLDDYIEKTLTYKPQYIQYMFDCSVLDTVAVVNEG